MTRCVIYVRVSSDEQVNGTSLETQEALCREYATRKGWDIVQVYREEGHSAKSGERPKFQEMISACCAARKGGVSIVLIWKSDRWMREGDEAAYYRVVLKKASGAKVVSVTEDFNDDAWGRANRRMMDSHAEIDNAARSERARISMERLQLSGYWTHQAPVGYATARRDGKPILIPHPVTGQHLAHVFDRIAAGALSVSGAVAELERRQVRGRSGRSISLARMHELLREPIYAGRIVTKWTRGQEIKAAFPGLVDATTFDRVQLVLAGRARVTAPRRATPADFPLRGFVHCAACATPMTAFHARGRTGARYAYYECHKRCPDSRGSKQTIEGQFIDMLDGVRAQYSPVMAVWQEVVADVWEQAHAQAAAARAQAADQAKKLQAKGARLLDLLIAETITDTVYRQRQAELDLELARQRVAAVDHSAADPAPALRAAADVLRDPAGYWLNLDAPNRVRFEVAMFRDGLQWSRGAGLQTIGSGCVYEVLKATGLKNPEWHPQADALQNILSAARAFEPFIALVAA